MSKLLCAGLIAVGLVIGSLVVGAQESTSENDLWVHPRGETYDPERHYRDEAGELYYKAGFRADPRDVTVRISPAVGRRVERAVAEITFARARETVTIDVAVARADGMAVVDRAVFTTYTR